MNVFGAPKFLGQVRLAQGPPWAWEQPYRPKPQEITVSPQKKPPAPKKPSETMTPEQKAGLPDETIDEIDLLCELASIMDRYLQGKGDIAYSDFAKAQQMIGEILDGYAPHEDEFIDKTIRPWCPQGVEILKGVVNEKIKAYEEQLEKEKGPARTMTPPLKTFPQMPTPPVAPTVTPMRPTVPIMTPLIETFPQMPTPPQAAPFETGNVPTLPTVPLPSIQPVIPTLAPAAPSAALVPNVAEGCPPGQFPAYPGGPCRGAVATGGLPGLPGGFGTADVTQGAMSMPAMPASSLVGSRARFPVMNWMP